LELRYLKAFLATAEHGSFSKAAAELNIAQSAVSRQIKLLEDAIGQQLIVRSSQKIVVTPKGRQLRELSRGFLQQIDELLYGPQKQTIRIGMIDGLLESWFHKLIATYSQTYPHNIRIKVDNFKNLEQGLTAGHYDMVVTPFELTSDLVRLTPIFDESRWLVSRTPIDREQLASYRWIIYNEEDLLFKLSDHPPKNFIEVDSMTTMLHLVEAGCGIAVLPAHVLTATSGLHKYRLERHQSSTLYLATLNYSQHQPDFQPLIELIKDQPPPTIAMSDETDC
jgi:DNA-binding transcriptional LysR family regulator